MKKLEYESLRKFRAEVLDYNERRGRAVFGLTEEPIAIQQIYGASHDGYVLLLRAAIRDAKGDQTCVAEWSSTIEVAEQVVTLWEQFECHYGSGCLVDIQKWLNCSPRWLIGEETIANAEMLIAKHGYAFRLSVLSFDYWQPGRSNDRQSRHEFERRQNVSEALSSV